jgi:hypothetical protein
MPTAVVNIVSSSIGNEVLGRPKCCPSRLLYVCKEKVMSGSPHDGNSNLYFSGTSNSVYIVGIERSKTSQDHTTRAWCARNTHRAVRRQYREDWQKESLADSGCTDDHHVNLGD